MVAKRFVEWPYRWTHRFEAEHLLERAGFAIEAVYGGYAARAVHLELRGDGLSRPLQASLRLGLKRTSP